VGDNGKRSCWPAVLPVPMPKTAMRGSKNKRVVAILYNQGFRPLVRRLTPPRADVGTKPPHASGPPPSMPRTNFASRLLRLPVRRFDFAHKLSANKAGRGPSICVSPSTATPRTRLWSRPCSSCFKDPLYRFRKTLTLATALRKDRPKELLGGPRHPNPRRPSSPTARYGTSRPAGFPCNE